MTIDEIIQAGGECAKSVNRLRTLHKRNSKVGCAKLEQETFIEETLASEKAPNLFDGLPATGRAVLRDHL